MLTKIKTAAKFLLKASIAYFTLGFTIFVIFFLLYFFSTFPVVESKTVLLRQTDYKELLKAGRELISKAQWKEYEEKYDGKIRRDLFIPKDVNIPEAISMLRKKLSGFGERITISNDSRLHIFFTGSRDMGNFGVLIFPEDFNEPEKGYVNKYDIMLIPGLWYFDDSLDEDTPSQWLGPKYKKSINILIKKNKYLKESK